MTDTFKARSGSFLIGIEARWKTILQIGFAQVEQHFSAFTTQYLLSKQRFLGLICLRGEIR